MEFSALFEMPYVPFTLIAFVGTLAFFIQIVLSCVGVGIDTEGSGLGDLGASDFSFRFLSVMSWSSFCMVGGVFGLYVLSATGSVAAAAAAGALAGSLTVFVMDRLKKALLRLQSEGTVKTANAVGKTARVYFAVRPGETGRVEVDVQGRRKYIDAVAKDGKAAFATGALVRVAAVLDDNVLVVEPLETAGAGEKGKEGE